jgi:YD repeat-containing protein
MKNSIKYLIIFGIIGFLLSCGKGTESTPAKVCKLQSERYSSQGSSDQATSYEYNAQKQLVKIVNTFGNTSSETETLTYDSNGFMTGLFSEYIYNSSGITYRTTTTSRCEYKNNMLSLISSQVNPSSGTAISESYTFEYDPQQKLSKVVYSSSNPSSSRQTYTFSNDKLIGYVSRTSTGVERQPYVIENGLLKRYNDTNGNYTNYEYDTQGRKIRTDNWQNGRITYSNLVTYEENGKNSEEAYPFYQLKGWDGFKIYQAAVGELHLGLRSKETTYYLSGSTLYKGSESVHNIVLNTKGFPTLINTNITNFNPTGTVNNTSNNSRTYTYTDCE